jgi:hypothetical protein
MYREQACTEQVLWAGNKRVLNVLVCKVHSVHGKSREQGTSLQGTNGRGTIIMHREFTSAFEKVIMCRKQAWAKHLNM